MMLPLLRLGLRRNSSPEAYRAMQEYLAEKTVDELAARGVDLAGRRVLELGAGQGGYSRVLSERAGAFVASDIHRDPVFDEDNADLEWVYVDVTESFPFDGATFDVVYCSSLIEHVAEPLTLLRESKRVLVPGGTMLLSFPPFWSLSMVGGHTFKPYHFLGERVATRLASAREGREIRSYSELDGARGGLFPLRIRDVEGLVEEVGFAVVDIYTRASRMNTATLPGILADLMTWHVCFLLENR